MPNGRRFFYILVILGIASTTVFWQLPANKYEWMKSDPVVGSPSAKLPQDPDAFATLVLYALPPVAFASATLLLAAMRLRGGTRVTAICFGLLVLAVVAVKFQLSLKQ